MLGDGLPVSLRRWEYPAWSPGSWGMPCLHARGYPARELRVLGMPCLEPQELRDILPESSGCWGHPACTLGVLGMPCL